MAEPRADEGPNLAEYSEVNRFEAIEAYRIGLDIASQRDADTPPSHYSYRERKLGAFHRRLVFNAALVSKAGSLYAVLRDSGDTRCPSITVNAGTPQETELFLPADAALEATREENLGISRALSDIYNSGINSQRTVELKKLNQKLDWVARVLKECSEPPTLPEERSDRWEAMIGYMAERFHYSSQHRLIMGGRTQEPDHAKRDWLEMTCLVRGNVLKLPPSIETAKIMN